MSLATRLSSTNTEIDSAMDTYVEGVYAQRTIEIDPEKGEETDHYEYIQAIDCITRFPNVPDDIKITLDGYKCPNVDTMQLQGDQGQVRQNKILQFKYIVNSCHSMTDIRAKFGQDPVTCVEYETLKADLD